MNIQSPKLEILLHSLVFKLMQAEDEEERGLLLEVWESAMDARRDYLEELKRIQDDGKTGRFLFKRPLPLSDEEKAERRMERKQRNAKWN